MRRLSIRPFLPGLLGALALLLAHHRFAAQAPLGADTAAWKATLAYGVPGRPWTVRLANALAAGDTAAIGAIELRAYSFLPTRFRDILAHGHEADVRRRAETAARYRREADLLQESYTSRFGQGTLTRIRATFEGLSAPERTRWVYLDRCLQLADTLQSHNRWAECDSLSRVAARGFESLKDDFGAGRAWTRAGNAITNLGFVARGADELEKALKILADCEAPFEVGRAGHNLATAYEALGRYDRAEQVLAQVYAVLPEIPVGMRAFIETDARSLDAKLRLDRGRFPEALQLYEEARRESRRLASPSGEAEDLHRFSLANAYLGQLGLALAEIDTAIVLARGDDNLKMVGDCLCDRGGLLVQMGRPQAADSSFSLAATIARTLGDPVALAGALSGQGRLDGLRGDVGQGEARLEQALALARRHGDAHHEGEYLIGLGQLNLDCARYVPAHRFFAGALAHADTIGLPDQAFEALLALGRIEQRLGRAGEAAAHYDSALALAHAADRRGMEIATRLRRADLSLDLGEFDQAENVARGAGAAANDCGAEGLELEALALQARSRLAAGRYAAAREVLIEARRRTSLPDYPRVAFELQWTAARVERAEGRLAEAEAAYDEAMARLDALTDRASVSELRAGLLSGRYAVYREAVDLRLARGDAAGAFECADHARSRSLVERLSLSGSMSPAESDPDTTAIRLRQELAALGAALQREEGGHGSPALMGALRARIGAARRALEDHLAWYARAAAAPVPATPPAPPLLARLRQRLAPGAAFIEYFEGEQGWRAFVIRADSILVVPLPALERGDGLFGRINAFRDALQMDYLHPEAPRDWMTPGAALYDDAWRPLLAGLTGVTRVCLAPEGALRALPFAALVATPAAAGTRATFLLESVVLSQTPSAEALLLAAERAARRGIVRGGWLGIAAGRPGAPLFGSAVEREIRESDGALLWPGNRTLAGHNATRMNVLREAPTSRWIHFACHAHFIRDAPRQSWLELTRTRDDDGRLEVDEIERLRLNARIVVLSACETAGEGGPGANGATGEELVGMVRAFLSAGADAVVASLWPVPDQAVPELMRGFYEELAQEPGQPALALNRAEVGLLGSGDAASRRSHPYLVAAFTLTGAGD